MATPQILISRSRMVPRIVPTRTAKAAKNYERCKKRLGCINQFRSGNQLESAARIGQVKCTSVQFASQNI